MKHLVIVESPAKGRTIEKFLGKDYTVKASFGHIRDLPEKKLGVDIDNGFEPVYEIDTEKKKVVSELKKLVKQADSVYIATDPDREGEAIGWHLCEALGLDANTVPRITFHEITKSAIEHAIQDAGHIDMNLVNAQQSRRVLDRLVGFQVSPVLWKRIRRGLSAGRVQSVAVRLVVEREREIQAFVPTESWKLKTPFTVDNKTFWAEFAKVSDKNKTLKDQSDAESILKALGIDAATSLVKESRDKRNVLIRSFTPGSAFTLASVQKKDTKRTPGAPFTTSTLQQEASRKLGFSTSQTMAVAQNLYQSGHISYMRTDSVNLSDLIINESKKFITETFGAEYALKDGRKYKTKQAGAQEAHEAIRPISVFRTPDTIGLDGNDLRLYRLIWERTVACQMREAEVALTTYVFTPNADPKQSWVASGEVITFAGFTKLYIEGDDRDDEEKEEASTTELPAMNEGTNITSSGFEARQLFSRPPARYSEAMLVKKLESEGIGRPSTYAPTIATIVDRGYVEKIEKRLHPTDVAFVVNDFLVAQFSKLLDYKFTANIETELDEVAEGKVEWKDMMGRFYADFKPTLDTALQDGGKIEEKVGRACPECEIGELVYKYGKTGRFIGCNRYPECTHVERDSESKREQVLDELRAEYEGKECPAGGTIVVKIGRFGPFLASSLYPEVKWIGKILSPKLKALEEVHGGKPCGVCADGIMHVKSSKRWPFLACSNYPECKHTENLPRTKKADEVGDDEA